jgi:putative tricarboxylic transport membrane protein
MPFLFREFIMTVRTAELLMAVVMALASAAIMFKSTELSIGWVPGRGPGAGAWPFWLATGLLLSCLWILVRWYRGTTPESRSTQVFMDGGAVYLVGTAVVALIALLVGTHIIGIYFSLIGFLFFFVKIFGKNKWGTSIAISLLTPVGIFIFFEWALKIPLPKGVSEPLFYPIYAIIY